MVIPESERYEYRSDALNVQLVNAIDNTIQLDKNFKQVPFKKLSGRERNSLQWYLQDKLNKEDNVGSQWVFFRSKNQKHPIIAYGANIAYSDIEQGREQVNNFLAHLNQQRKARKRVFGLLSLLMIAAISALIWSTYIQDVLPKLMGVFKQGNTTAKSKATAVRHILQGNDEAMKFYEKVFPDVYAWKSDSDEEKKQIADELLQPQYIKHILSHTRGNFWSQATSSPNNQDTPKTIRFVLFDLFNYNEEIHKTWEKYRDRLKDTTFGKLYRKYSFLNTNFSNTILYYKVGDISIEQKDISEYLQEHNIGDMDYKKVREADIASKFQMTEEIKQEFKKFLEAGLHSHIPLKIVRSQDTAWYLCVETEKSSQAISFAAFFKKDRYTLVPKEKGRILTQMYLPDSFKWYQITPEQAEQLKLSDNSTIYLQSGAAQTPRINILMKKISELNLQPIEKLEVQTYHELLMSDDQGKYGLQSNDPITSLLLANLIREESFKDTKKTSLTRDEVSIHVDSIQLSKESTFSDTITNISPGQQDILTAFQKADSFVGKFSNGKQEITFNNIEKDMFTTYGFTIVGNAIVFIRKNEEIDQMIITVGGNDYKIIKDEAEYKIIPTK